MKIPVKLFPHGQAIRSERGDIFSIRGEFKFYVKSNHNKDYFVYLNTSVFNPEIIYSGSKEECEKVMKKLTKHLVSKPLDLKE